MVGQPESPNELRGGLHGERAGSVLPGLVGDLLRGPSTFLGINKTLLAKLPCDHRVRFGGTSHRVDELLRRVPARAWRGVSAGKGAKGHRLYDRAVVRLDHDDPAPIGQAGPHWLLVSRNSRTGELAFYRCSVPGRTRWPFWSGSPAGAGGSRRPSRPARAFVALTSTRFVAGAPGTAGPTWPCSPTPS
jgi:hypothetical protein